jgi:hypothetical protein
MSWRRIGAVGLSLGLVLAALTALLLSLLFYAYLGGDPTPDGARCAGGHTGWALALVLTAPMALLTAMVAVFAAVRGLSPWSRWAALTLVLIAGWVMLAVLSPEFSSPNVGQC